MSEFMVYYSYKKPGNRGGGECPMVAENEVAAVEAFIRQFELTEWAKPFDRSLFSAHAVPSIDEIQRTRIVKALKTLTPEELEALINDVLADE